MTDRKRMDSRPKAVLSVSEMARQIGMSRSRFNDLIGKEVFPPPAYLLSNRRPCYFKDQQQRIVSIRQKGMGWNGQPVIFYSRRKKTRRRESTGQTVRNHEGSEHAEMVQVLRTLGLSKVKAEHVESAIEACYPDGTDGVPESDLVGVIFRHLSSRGDYGNRR